MPFREVSAGAREQLSEERLRDLYLGQHHSLGDIGRMIGIHPDTIRYYLIKHGIPRRTRSEAHQIRMHRKGKWQKSERGEKSPNWKGGRRITSTGYVEVRMPDHPRARCSGYVFEHLVVWMKEYGDIPLGWPP